MFTGFQSGDGDLGMRGIGCANADSVDGRIGKKILVGTEDLTPIFLRQGTGTGMVEIEKPCQLCVAIVSVFGDMPHLRDFAASDHSDFNSHSTLPPLFSIGVRPVMNCFLSSAAVLHR